MKLDFIFLVFLSIGVCTKKSAGQSVGTDQKIYVINEKIIGGDSSSYQYRDGIEYEFALVFSNVPIEYKDKNYEVIFRLEDMKGMVLFDSRYSDYKDKKTMATAAYPTGESTGYGIDEYNKLFIPTIELALPEGKNTCRLILSAKQGGLYHDFSIRNITFWSKSRFDKKKEAGGYKVEKFKFVENKYIPSEKQTGLSCQFDLYPSEIKDFTYLNWRLENKEGHVFYQSANKKMAGKAGKKQKMDLFIPYSGMPWLKDNNEYQLILNYQYGNKSYDFWSKEISFGGNKDYMNIGNNQEISILNFSFKENATYFYKNTQGLSCEFDLGFSELIKGFDNKIYEVTWCLKDTKNRVVYTSENASDVGRNKIDACIKTAFEESTKILKAKNIPSEIFIAYKDLNLAEGTHNLKLVLSAKHWSKNIPDFWSKDISFDYYKSKVNLFDNRGFYISSFELKEDYTNNQAAFSGLRCNFNFDFRGIEDGFDTLVWHLEDLSENIRFSSEGYQEIKLYMGSYGSHEQKIYLTLPSKEMKGLSSKEKYRLILSLKGKGGNVFDFWSKQISFRTAEEINAYFQKQFFSVKDFKIENSVREQALNITYEINQVEKLENDGNSYYKTPWELLDASGKLIYDSQQDYRTKGFSVTQSALDDKNNSMRIQRARIDYEFLTVSGKQDLTFILYAMSGKQKVKIYETTTTVDLPVIQSFDKQTFTVKNLKFENSSSIGLQQLEIHYDMYLKYGPGDVKEENYDLAWELLDEKGTIVFNSKNHFFSQNRTLLVSSYKKSKKGGYYNDERIAAEYKDLRISGKHDLTIKMYIIYEGKKTPIHEQTTSVTIDKLHSFEEQEYTVANLKTREGKQYGVLGINISFDCKLKYNKISDEGSGRSIYFYAKLKTDNQDIYNPEGTKPTDRLEEYTIISSFDYSTKPTSDYHPITLFIPYFLLKAQDGKYEADLSVCVTNYDGTSKINVLKTSTISVTKPPTIKAIFKLEELSLIDKVYDAAFGTNFENQKSDTQWMLKAGDFYLYKSDIHQNTNEGIKGEGTVTISKGDELQLLIIDHDNFLNPSDFLAAITLSYGEKKLEVKNYKKGDVKNLTYTLNIE